MANPPARPPRRARQARLMRVINVPMRFLLGLPFATPLSGQLMLLSFAGRKTGKAYRQPVSYVPDGDTLLTPGGGNWKLNLRQGQPIKVHLRGRDVRLRPELIGDVDEVERLLRTMMTVNPRVTAFVPVMGPDGQIDRGKLEAAVRYGFRIIRWHFDRTQSDQKNCAPITRLSRAASTTSLDTICSALIWRMRGGTHALVLQAAEAIAAKRGAKFAHVLAREIQEASGYPLLPSSIVGPSDGGVVRTTEWPEEPRP